jgi:hypothetical protein
MDVQSNSSKDGGQGSKASKQNTGKQARKQQK